MSLNNLYFNMCFLYQLIMFDFLRLRLTHNYSKIVSIFSIVHSLALYSSSTAYNYIWYIYSKNVLNVFIAYGWTTSSLLWHATTLVSFIYTWSLIPAKRYWLLYSDWFTSYLIRALVPYHSQLLLLLNHVVIVVN